MLLLRYYCAAAETSQEECSVVKVKCQTVDDEIVCKTWDFENAIFTDLCLLDVRPCRVDCQIVTDTPVYGTAVTLKQPHLHLRKTEPQEKINPLQSVGNSRWMYAQ